MGILIDSEKMEEQNTLVKFLHAGPQQPDRLARDVAAVGAILLAREYAVPQCRGIVGHSLCIEGADRLYEIAAEGLRPADRHRRRPGIDVHRRNVDSQMRP